MPSTPTHECTHTCFHTHQHTHTHSPTSHATPSRAQDKGRTFRESFLSKIALLLRGTVAAPADRFGETLGDEHMRGGERGARRAA